MIKPTIPTIVPKRIEARPCRKCTLWQKDGMWGKCFKKSKWRFPNETCGDWKEEV